MNATDEKLIPDVVLRAIQFHLTKLRDVETALAGVERARGHGHILALEFRDRTPVMTGSFSRLTEIHELACDNGVEDQFLAVVKTHGPSNLQHYGALAEIAPAWWPSQHTPESVEAIDRPRG